MLRKPKITVAREGGDNGSSYVIRVDGRAFVTGLTRSEIPYYRQQALLHWRRTTLRREK